MQTIRFAGAGDAAMPGLVRRLDALAGGDPDLDALRGTLRTFEALDRQYGASAPLALEDVPDLVAAAMGELARLDARLTDRENAPRRRELAEVTLGVAIWALRHGLEIGAAEPVVNALAIRSNAAAKGAELAAVFRLMRGLVEHLKPRLAADLERSNPERPWRILHANLAITAIRTEEPALMELAFDALDEALPDERAGFYAEALALALAPGIAPAVRERIEARHRKWTCGMP
jgi:hypothetical protein